MMIKWKDKLSDKSIFYVTPDVKRGIGLEAELPNFHIVCSYIDPLIPVLRRQGANIFCLEEIIGDEITKYSNTGRLIEHAKVSEYIKKYSKDAAYILVFKPSEKMEMICKVKGYNLLVNTSELNNLFENKVEFFKITSDNNFDFQIPGIIGILGKLDHVQLSQHLGLPYVVQFAHGWAGKTTYFIKNEPDFNLLQSKFPYTRAKVNKYIDGITLLNNACIFANSVLVGPPAIQISGIEILEEKKGVTCGRQWTAGFITEEEEGRIKEITEIIGKLMIRRGYRGYFGLDFIMDKNDRKIYLSENNARFTASSAFYTKLELGNGNIPLLFYHLAAFLNINIPKNYYADSGIVGSQVIFRNPDRQPKVDPKINYGIFRTSDFTIVSKDDYKPQLMGSDEFIFIKRHREISTGDDLELSRIETRGQVLQERDKFQEWINKLLV